MTNKCVLCLAVGLALLTGAPAVAQQKWVLAIHGGAGGLPSNMPPETLTKMRDTMRLALTTGGDVLAAGGSSVDAVEAAVRIMEDSCVFNSGCGAALDHEGQATLDASIMNGADKTAGAVAAVRYTANPIMLARKVMEQSPHVLIVGDGADAFARAQGMTMKPAEYFISPRRKAEWQRVLEAEKKKRDTPPAPAGSKGTVGAVAMDARGNLAAATSTGGLTNKRVGRVGDSPIIGAGTYAENGVCAISATGAGEYFIRFTAAADICARVRYRNEPIATAASGVIAALKEAGGAGGVIALDGKGELSMPYSTPTMARGSIDATHGPEIVLEVRP